MLLEDRGDVRHAPAETIQAADDNDVSITTLDSSKSTREPWTIALASAGDVSLDVDEVPASLLAGGDDGGSLRIEPEPGAFLLLCRRT
jgi:hypothetical protein